MLTASISGLRACGSSAAAFSLIALLAGVLIERHVFVPRMTHKAATLAAFAPLAVESALPDLRRIVLDPCTGLEKPQSQAHAAKVD